MISERRAKREYGIQSRIENIALTEPTYDPIKKLNFSKSSPLLYGCVCGTVFEGSLGNPNLS